jgi:ElaB/YqjD/DUF883 family membrane-anchored ribosome-binding protein
MYTDTFTGRWDQLREDVKRQWSRLTDDDLDQIKGNLEALVRLVQEKYEYTTEEAQREVTRFLDDHNGRTTQMVRRIPSDMDHEVRQHPWAAIATAIGLGIVLGFLVRPGHAS